MIRLSSIFSFETLRLRPWFPKATLAALLLLAGAEGLARYAVHKGKLHVDASGRQLIADHRRAIARNKEDIWLLGNSTLGYGVNEKILGEQTGAHFLKLPHGSATVGASAKILNYYLELDAAKAHPPREVVVFVTKDDLNLHGYRAEVSAEYENLTKDPMRRPQEFFMLWQTRTHIAERVDAMLHGPKIKDKKEGIFNGVIIDNDEMYTRLIQNFEMDQTAIPNVAKAAHQHGVQNVAIVLVPCTDVYVQFHDRHFPNQPYAKIRAEMAAECRQCGVKFYDFGDPSTSYKEFQDGYHLNDDGAKRFTSQLVDSHVLIAPVNINASPEAPSSATVNSVSSPLPAHADVDVAD